MILVCGCGLSLAIDDVTETYQAILNIFAVYYVFDLKYPAQYGILEIIDKLCLLQSSETLPSKKKSRGVLSSLNKFEKSFLKFVKAEEEKQKKNSRTNQENQFNTQGDMEVIESQAQLEEAQFSQEISSPIS